MGAIIGGLKKKQIRALADFGLHFGLAYQIIDDCLDKTASENITRKTSGLDVKSGKKTLPDIYQSTKKAKEKAEHHMAVALKSLAGSISTTKQLPFVELTNFVLSYVKGV